MATTEVFRRLPPDAAIPFVGFDFARIPSRQDILVKIRTFIDYCIESAKSPSVRVILGEWGEGKSEAYVRYIKPTLEQSRNYATSIDAKAVANSYRQLETLSPLPADQFLAAVFYAVRTQEKNSASPAYERYGDIQTWLPEFLNHLTRTRNRKAFIFIDEFEDLIPEPEILKKILTGLKATINGQYQPIGDGGDFQGLVHFFLSCTPDAYNKMRNDPELSQVFGSYDRRVDTIDLQPVLPSEGLKFLWDLLSYAYESSLPDPLPISSAGVLNTIYTIGRGNLGALVSLLTRLLHRAKTSDHRLRILDYAFLLEVLPGENISILGSSWRCLDKPFLDSVLHRFDEVKITRGYHSVFKLLAGELIPFSVGSTSQRTRVVEQTVPSVIHEMNRALESIGVSHAILSMVPVDEHWDFPTIFRDFTDIDKEHLQLGDFRGSLPQLLQRLEFPILSNNRILLRRFFPHGAHAIQSYFKGISVEEARSILSRLPTDPAEPHYSLAVDMVSELYPTPAPAALDFVKNPETRAKVWRHVSTDFERVFNASGAAPFVHMIAKCQDISLQVEGPSVEAGKTALIRVREKQRDIAFNVRVIANLGNVSGEALRAAAEQMSPKHAPVQVIWVFHTGDQPETFAHTGYSHAFFDRLLLIYCHPTLTKRILSTYILSQDHPTEISQPSFERAVREMVVTELRFQQKWDEWILQAAQKGLAIKDLIRASAKTEKDLADGMKFYLNCIDEPLTPDQVFVENNRIRDLTVYDTKIGLIPDIESSEQLIQITTDLQSNKFIELNSSGFKILQTPVELRLLSELPQNARNTQQQLRDLFLILASNKSVLEQVYLPLLEFKGQITRTKGEYIRSVRRNSVEALAKKMSNYDRQIAIYRSRNTFKEAHIYVTKKRDSRLIRLPTFDARIRAEYNKITEKKKDEFVLSKARLVDMLLDVFGTSLYPKLELSQQQRKTIHAQVKSLKATCGSDLDLLRAEFVRWTGFNFENKQVREFQRIEAGLAEVEGILEADLDTFSEEWISKVPSDDFSYKNFDDDQRSFDISIHLALSHLSGIDNMAQALHGEVSQTEKLTADLKRDIADIHSSLATLHVRTGLALTEATRSFLSRTSEGEHIDQPSSDLVQWEGSLSLQEIATEIKRSRSKMEESIQFQQRLVSVVRKLIEVEDKFVVSLEQASRKAEAAHKVFDTEPYAGEFERERKHLDVFRQEYEGFQQQIAAAFDSRSLKIALFSQTLNDLEQLTLSTASVSEKFDDIWNVFKRELGAELQTFLRAVRSLHRSAEKETIESQTLQLQSRLSRSSFSTPTGRMSELLQMFHSIRERFRKCLTTFLTEDEARVLDSLASIGSLTGNWVSQIDLAQEVAKRTGFTSDHSAKCLRSLADRGLLTIGYRMAQ